MASPGPRHHWPHSTPAPPPTPKACRQRSPSPFTSLYQTWSGVFFFFSPKVPSISKLNCQQIILLSELVTPVFSSSEKYITVYQAVYQCCIFLIGYSWFTVLCYILLYSTTNQLYIYLHIYIHTYRSTLRLFLIQAITEYWVAFPELYSRSFLVIYFIYSSVYTSVPIFNLSPTHCNHKFVFYICDSISIL